MASHAPATPPGVPVGDGVAESFDFPSVGSAVGSWTCSLTTTLLTRACLGHDLGFAADRNGLVATCHRANDGDTLTTDRPDAADGGLR